MKTEKVLKMFSEAVKTKGYRLDDQSTISNDDYRFAFHGSFVGLSGKDGDELTYLKSITTLKELKIRLGL